MSAPEGESADISKEEAIERVLDIPIDPDDNDSPTLGESDRVLQSLLDTGGETEYARIFLAATTGTYNGNRMLWLRYVWLSKPGAFESDMFGENGISIRMVDGMENALASMMAAACNRLDAGVDDGEDPVYVEV